MKIGSTNLLLTFKDGSHCMMQKPVAFFFFAPHGQDDPRPSTSFKFEFERAATCAHYYLRSLCIIVSRPLLKALADKEGVFKL